MNSSRFDVHFGMLTALKHGCMMVGLSPSDGCQVSCHLKREQQTFLSTKLCNVWAELKAALRLLVLPFALVLALAACSGGGSNDAADQTVAVSGVVSDDVIVGATVKLTDLTGKVLGSATTDVNGRYSISGIAPVALRQGYKVTSTGGTMAGVPFTATMTAIYSGGDVFTDSNITLITSAVTEALTGAIPTGASSREVLRERDRVISSMAAAGVIVRSMPIRLTPKALHVVITALPVQTNPPQRRTHRRSAL